MKNLAVASLLAISASTQALGGEIFLPSVKRSVNLRTNHSCLQAYDLAISRAESEEFGRHSQALHDGATISEELTGSENVTGIDTIWCNTFTVIGGVVGIAGGPSGVVGGIAAGCLGGATVGALGTRASYKLQTLWGQSRGYAIRDKIESQLKPLLYGIVQAHEYQPGSKAEHYPALVKLKNDTVGTRASLDHFAASLVLADGRRELCRKDGSVLNKATLASVLRPKFADLRSVANFSVSSTKISTEERSSQTTTLNGASSVAK